MLDIVEKNMVALSDVFKQVEYQVCHKKSFYLSDFFVPIYFYIYYN